MGVRLPLRRLGQCRAVESVVERLGPQPLEQLVPGHGLVGRQQHQAEAAGVVETDLPALVGLEHDMVVPLERMLGGARRVVQGHAARHAEMGDQGVAVVEPEQQVFRPPVDGQHRAALDPLGEPGRQRHPEVAAALDEANDAPADQSRNETAADGFDLGQLGHVLQAPYVPRWPNKAVPTRTWVAPSRTAVS